jgi:hypothetical protein
MVILKKDVTSSLQRFVQRKIEEMISELDELIKNHKGNDEALMEHLLHKKRLHENWANVAKELGTVIIKK